MALFTATANLGLIAQDAVQVARGVRSALTGDRGAENFFAWISAQADADLTGIGFSSSDVSAMKSMAADLSAFAAIYRGSQPPISYPQLSAAYAFENSSTQIIGPG